MASVEQVVIDFADPETRSAILLAGMSWGIAVLVTIYNIASDLWAMARSGKKSKGRPERRFIEPCAEGLHTYDEGVCTTCKQPEPDTQP